MGDILADAEAKASLISEHLSSSQSDHARKIVKRADNAELSLLDQEPRRESFQASLDALVECRDKFRFQEDRVHSDCDTLEKQIEVVREQRQKSFIQLAQKTEEQKKQLEKIKCQCEMYERLMHFGIEELAPGKFRGVIFKPKSLAYCDLDDIEQQRDDKENAQDSQQRYAKLNGIFSEFEVAENWKHLL